MHRAGPARPDRRTATPGSPLALGPVALGLITSLVGTGMAGCQTESPAPQAATEAAPTDAEQVRIGGVLWYVDYDAALEVAREQDKALWVHFGENPG